MIDKFVYNCLKTKKEININYQQTGKGKQVAIIMHGWGQNLQTMRSVAASLNEEYVVYNIDLPGFGSSTMPNNWTIEDYSKAIETFMIDKNIEQATVIGHSFGGRIGIMLATTTTLLKHLVLIDSAGIKQAQKIRTKIKINTYKIMKKFINLPLVNKNKSEYEFNLKQIFGSKDYNQANQQLRQIMLNAVNLDLTPKLSEIQCRTTLFWGINDKDTPYSDAKKMNKLIHDSKLYSFESAHYPFLEAPEEFFKQFKIALGIGVDNGI